jgi:hypothetical protein
VRDVLTLFNYRPELMLKLDDPLFENWDQDASAIEQDYAHADAGVVVQELHVAARAIAAAFAAVTGDQWERTGRRSDGAMFTVASFARTSFTTRCTTCTTRALVTTYYARPCSATETSRNSTVRTFRVTVIGSGSTLG